MLRYIRVDDAQWLLRTHMVNMVPSECDLDDVNFIKQFAKIVGVRARPGVCVLWAIVGWRVGQLFGS